jgi:hypothetical protein
MINQYSIFFFFGFSSWRNSIGWKYNINQTSNYNYLSFELKKKGTKGQRTISILINKNILVDLKDYFHHSYKK